MGDSRGIILTSDQDLTKAIKIFFIYGPIYGYVYSKQSSIFPIAILHACWDIFCFGLL